MDTLQLAGVLREAGVMGGLKEGTIYRLELSVVGHWLWKPWKTSKRASDPWGFSPGHSDHWLGWVCVMANTRKDALAVHLRDVHGNADTSRPLGVTLLHFTEWALPYVRLEDDGQDVWEVGWVGKGGPN